MDAINFYGHSNETALVPRSLRRQSIRLFSTIHKVPHFFCFDFFTASLLSILFTIRQIKPFISVCEFNSFMLISRRLPIELAPDKLRSVHTVNDVECIGVTKSLILHMHCMPACQCNDGRFQRSLRMHFWNKWACLLYPVQFSLLHCVYLYGVKTNALLKDTFRIHWWFTLVLVQVSTTLENIRLCS